MFFRIIATKSAHYFLWKGLRPDWPLEGVSKPTTPPFGHLAKLTHVIFCNERAPPLLLKFRHLTWLHATHCSATSRAPQSSSRLLYVLPTIHRTGSGCCYDYLVPNSSSVPDTLFRTVFSAPSGLTAGPLPAYMGQYYPLGTGCRNGSQQTARTISRRPLSQPVRRTSREPQHFLGKFAKSSAITKED